MSAAEPSIPDTLQLGPERMYSTMAKYSESFGSSNITVEGCLHSMQEFGIEAYIPLFPIVPLCTVPEMKVFVWCFVLFPDECLIENGGCEHLCEKGGKCSCLTGYQLLDDDKHCQGTAQLTHVNIRHFCTLSFLLSTWPCSRRTPLSQISA